MRARLESLPESIWLVLLVGAWAELVALSVVLCGTGFIHPESYSFFPHYLSGRPLLEQIYDNRVTDWDNYQAREFGFVFDWMDAHFIAWCVERGHPHFFSLIHYLFLLGSGVALWRIATRYLALSRLASFGLVLLIWSAPSAMLYTSFYRSAKVDLFFMTLLVVLAYFHARKSNSPWATRFGLLLFGICAALLPMFDKQGFLFLGAIVLFLAWQVGAQRTLRDRQLLIAGALALAFAWCYQRFLGPAATRHLLGYEVNRGYTTIPFAALFTQPRFLATVVFGAPLLTFDSFRFPLGNLPAGLALLAGWWVWRQFAASPAPPRWLGAGWLFVGLVLFIMAVYAAMLMLFPLMLSSEHRRFFYGLPVTALWIVAAAAALGIAGRRQPAQQPLLEIVVAALVLSNLAALQEHRFVLRHGKYQPFVDNAAHVLDALRPQNIAAAQLTTAEASELLAKAEYYRDAVPPSLREDRIYLTLFLRARGVQVGSPTR